MPDIKYLMGNPWPNVKWGEVDRPTIIVDGLPYSIKDLERGEIQGDLAYVVGSNEKNIELICSRINPLLIQFYEMRVGDISTINNLKRLTHLAVRWNTKVTDINPISRLGNLDTLIIEDTPKVTSITPLSKLKNLRYLDYSGGIWNKNGAETLQPISELENLEYLALNNIGIGDGSLAPIAKCRNIKELDVCNKFKTEEFAYLAANMPNTQCDKFQPYIKMRQSIGEHDVMVVGSRKPFLNSVKDKDKLEKYKAAFDALIDKYSLNKRIN